MDGVQHQRRPRPVADAPIAALADGTAVTKAWLLALVAGAPLHRAATVPAAGLARGGPAFCAALLEALRSDEALERFCGPTELGERLPLAAVAGRLSGARTPAAVAAAVEALRGAAWAALLHELRDPPTALVGELADRLAHVCAHVTRASLEHAPPESPGRSGPLADVLSGAPPAGTEQPPPTEPRAPTAPPAAATPGAAAQTPAAATAPAATAPAAAARAAAARAAAARAAAPSPAADDPLAPDPLAPAADDPPLSLVDHRPGRSPATDDPSPPDGAHVVGPPVPEPPEDAVPRARFAIPRDFDRDIGSPSLPPPVNGAAANVTRVMPPRTWGGDADEPPWRAAIARRLERRAADGLPFAVLAVEVDDLDRLLASETGREVAFALEVAERGLTAELAPADLVVRERLGRWWLTSPDCDTAAARDLAQRVADAVAQAVLGGAPLRASIGVASCPDDGDDLDSLAQRADVGVFTARSGGLSLG